MTANQDRAKVAVLRVEWRVEDERSRSKVAVLRVEWRVEDERSRSKVAVLRVEWRVEDERSSSEAQKCQNQRRCIRSAVHALVRLHVGRVQYSSYACIGAMHPVRFIACVMDELI